MIDVIWEKMKSKDLEKAVKIKYENEDEPAKIHRDFGGVVSKRRIKLWWTITGFIEFSYSSGRPRIALVQKSTSQRQNAVSITINGYQQED